MAQVDMTMSAEEAQEQTSPGIEQPRYPYGLRISLDDDSLAKLGLTQLPTVGAKLQLSATVEVCSTSAYQDQEGEPEQSVSLQITAMELGAAQQTQSAASALYGE